MQQRIPRSEVEQVHKVVFEAVKEVLGIQDQPDADCLHCRVTGSYIRGKPMTGGALLICICLFLQLMHCMQTWQLGIVVALPCCTKLSYQPVKTVM